MSLQAIPSNAQAVTPADDAASFPAATLWVGVYGDINVLLSDMDDSNDSADGIVFKNVQGNFPRAVKKVFATGTTATDIVRDL